MIDEYNGDPRKIWNAQRDVNVVRERLLEIPGIGTGIAEMTLLILARNKGLLGGRKAKPHINVKPDVHVRRVFIRSGLVKRGASDREVMDTARELAPDFPGSLDAPCWDIGRKYCRPRRPDCAECPLTAVCPGTGLSTRRE
ncbi:MAG: hypothetical protein JW958_00175 [Candidatus Eisenbacteria bacterium]|nr:hypothetical protein [Candidatus Eisenbacteria bacterium]